MTKSVISLAFIGLSDFDNDPLLQSITLQQRFQISAAFSACYRKLDDLTKQLKIAPMGSCRQLLGSHLVEGVIWNSEAADIYPERLGLGKAAKHLLIRSDVLSHLSLERILSLQEQAANTQTEILPELIHRWTPATLRLRELVATQLGPIEQITVHQNSQSAMTSHLFQVVDWLRMLLSLRKCVVTAKDPNSTLIEFDRSEQKSVRCEIDVSRSANDITLEPDVVVSEVPLISIRCDAGELEIQSASKLRWQTELDWQDESLESERTAEQVMLDLFGRRIAGGIVPVPDLMEVLRTQRLLAAIEESQSTGEAIHVDEASLPVNDGKFCF